MGLLSEARAADVDGHRVVVRAEVQFERLGGKYFLELDGRVCDQRVATLGAFALEGSLPDGRPVEVRVRQGLLGTKYALRVAGAELPLVDADRDPEVASRARAHRGRLWLGVVDVYAGALVAAGAGGAAQELLEGELQFGALWLAMVAVGATGLLAHWNLKKGLLLFGAAHAAAALALLWS